MSRLLNYEEAVHCYFSLKTIRCESKLTESNQLRLINEFPSEMTQEFLKIEFISKC